MLTDLSRHLSEDVTTGMLTDETLKKLFKNPQQGASTTVWAASAAILEGKGGHYLEECQISKPWVETSGQWGMGYSAWAYDEEKEGKLWKKSLELVGLKDDA